MILFRIDSEWGFCTQSKCRAFLKFKEGNVNISFIPRVMSHYERCHSNVWKMVVLADSFEIKFDDDIWEQTVSLWSSQRITPEPLPLFRETQDDSI